MALQWRVHFTTVKVFRWEPHFYLVASVQSWSTQSLLLSSQQQLCSPFIISFLSLSHFSHYLISLISSLLSLSHFSHFLISLISFLCKLNWARNSLLKSLVIGLSQAVLLYYCSDCLSCLAQLNSKDFHKLGFKAKSSFENHMRTHYTRMQKLYMFNSHYWCSQ